MNNKGDYRFPGPLSLVMSCWYYNLSRYKIQQLLLIADPRGCFEGVETGHMYAIVL